MELKDTLNLPKTEFPMRADLAKREPHRIAHWESIQLYQRIQERRKGQNAPKFILHDGPPFTNGDVHIGTALNKILKDCVLRYKSMQGFETPFIPGWDCHGLPIEHKVMQEIKESKPKLDIPQIRQACQNFSQGYIEKQTAQFKRLGVLADWDSSYKTLDPKYEGNILDTLASCVEQGLVYRSKKPVYWSIPCQTALAEGEIEYKDHISPSLWVSFRVEEKDMPKLGSFSKPAFFVIWTTTPWTLPANLGIAVHPELEYEALDMGHCVYIVAQKLVNSFIAACALPNPTIVGSYIGKMLEGIQTKHPFLNRLSPIVLGTYVTTESGTGCVHTAPGHGLDDYVTGLKYGLDIYSPISDNGTYLDDGLIPKQLVGASILAKKDVPLANTAVINLLKEQGALLKEEAYSHSYPHCWRSKTPVIFRATDQWFISLDKDNLRQRVLAATQAVQWVPEWGQKRIKGSIETRPDWCISRQRSWGVPLPVFYDENGKPLLSASLIRVIAEKVKMHGSQIWFEQSAEKLLEGVSLPKEFANTKLIKGTDTLDVWIDSGSSHQAVLKTNPQLSFPADLYLEGSDQHRGWFQSSLWTSIITNNTPPYKKIITHGFVVDENKKKISKSDAKPQTATSYVNEFGADIIRLWICSEDYKNDVPISENIVKQVVQTYRTIRNTFRFQLGNLYDFNFQTDALPTQDWTYLEKWALHELNLLIANTTKAYENYEFHKAYQYINRFCSVVLSATYHDVLKDRLYTYGPTWPERRCAQTAIYHIFNVLARLLAPILTFTCDEAWSYLHSGNDLSDHSIHLQDWPTYNPEWVFDDIHSDVEHLLKFKEKLNEAMEKARQNKQIGQSLDAKVHITVDFSTQLGQILQRYYHKLPELFIVSEVTLEKGAQTSLAIQNASGVRCPRTWRWVSQLVDCPPFGSVSARCKEALYAKYNNTPLIPITHERSKN